MSTAVAQLPRLQQLPPEGSANLFDRHPEHLIADTVYGLSSMLR